MRNLKLLILVLPFLCSCQTGTKEPAKIEKPNIIFILTDDQRWDALGYAGNEIIHTPEMDRLAAEGVYFEKAFVTTPICAASRASIFTGLYERTHGYTFQQGPLKDAYFDISYPAILNQNNYYNGFFGKFGVNFKNAKNHFDIFDSYDRNGNYPDRRGYFYKTIDKDTVHLTRYTGHQALEFIKNAPADRPFCLSLSFSAPHAHDNATEQYFWQEKSNHLHAGEVMPPPLLAEDKYFNALPLEVRKGFNRLRWHWRFDTPEKYQHSVKGYYRMITEIDDEIREIRKLLEEKGIADNTVIILMGDNGYYLGERQLAGKWLMHDNSLQVPLIIHDPRTKKHRTVKDMVINLDVTSTILDLAGINVPEEYQGISLLPYIRGKKNGKEREAILFEHLWDLPEIPSSEGIRTDKWKYFRYRLIEAPEELYDLENDPLEINNLASDPAYTNILEQLRQECEKQASAYTDAKLVSDYTPASEIDMTF
jgi:alpha-L-rhamnosidase